MSKGLYIHIPFCWSKCNYCSFVSYVVDGFNIDRYIDALEKESSEYEGARVDTIYFGGGTPSVLSIEQMTKLFRVISKFDTSSVREVTMEINPDSIDEEKSHFLSFFINRVSVGAQSFNDEELRILGRRHSVDDIYKTFGLLRKYGFRNVNFDLIYGTPGQDMKSWERSLLSAISLGPEHISIYPLTLEPGMRLYGMNINEDLQADMYELATEILTSAGYKNYEISNFSLDGFKCQHNLKYWNFEEYIGLGAGAVSYVSGKIYENSRDLNEYINHRKREKFELSPELEESIRNIMKLRTSSWVDLKPEVVRKVRGFSKFGLIERRKNRIRLTKKGKLLANRVMLELLPA